MKILKRLLEAFQNRWSTPWRYVTEGTTFSTDVHPFSTTLISCMRNEHNECLCGRVLEVICRELFPKRWKNCYLYFDVREGGKHFAKKSMWISGHTLTSQWAGHLPRLSKSTATVKRVSEIRKFEIPPVAYDCNNFLRTFCAINFTHVVTLCTGIKALRVCENSRLLNIKTRSGVIFQY